MQPLFFPDLFHSSCSEVLTIDTRTSYNGKLLSQCVKEGLWYSISMTLSLHSKAKQHNQKAVIAMSNTVVPVFYGQIGGGRMREVAACQGQI